MIDFDVIYKQIESGDVARDIILMRLAEICRDQQRDIAILNKKVTFLEQLEIERN